MTHMVDIAQSVEQLIVVQQVARSSGGAFVIALSGSGHDTQAGALSGVLVS